MFRSNGPPAAARISGRGPSGTLIATSASHAQRAGEVTPGTAPAPDLTRESPRSVRSPAPRVAREAKPAALRRLDKCMFLEYDAHEHRWRDALNRTGRQPSPGPPTLRREPEREPAAARDSLLPLPMGPPVWENPLVVGLLLAICPPVGVTLAWSARSIPHAGRVALTMFGGFVMLTATLLACLLLTG